MFSLSLCDESHHHHYCMRIWPIRDDMYEEKTPNPVLDFPTKFDTHSKRTCVRAQVKYFVIFNDRTPRTEPLIKTLSQVEMKISQREIETFEQFV